MKVDTIKYIADFYSSLRLSSGQGFCHGQFDEYDKNFDRVLPLLPYAWSVNGGATFSTAANPSINLAPGTYTHLP
jgi:hypothetical protein